MYDLSLSHSSQHCPVLSVFLGLTFNLSHALNGQFLPLLFLLKDGRPSDESTRARVTAAIKQDSVSEAHPAFITSTLSCTTLTLHTVLNTTG